MNLRTYNLHRNTFLKAAEVGIVQQQTNLPSSGGSDVALEIDGTTVESVIPVGKHWQGYRLANIPTATVPCTRDMGISGLNGLQFHLLRYTGLASGTQNPNAQYPMSAQHLKSAEQRDFANG